MLLNGIIDAAVNGGTKIYTQLFLSPKYAESRPQDTELCNRLRTLLVDQVDKVVVVERIRRKIDSQFCLLQVAQGLAVHRSACPDSLLGLQSKMEEFFSALEQQMVPFGYIVPERSSPRSERPSARTMSTTTASVSRTSLSEDAVDVPVEKAALSGPVPKAALRPPVSPRSGTIASTSAVVNSAAPLRQSGLTMQKQKSAGNLGTAVQPAPELQKKKSFGSIRREPK
jgi:hypothetical protein